MGNTMNNCSLLFFEKIPYSFFKTKISIFFIKTINLFIMFIAIDIITKLMLIVRGLKILYSFNNFDKFSTYFE